MVIDQSRDRCYLVLTVVFGTFPLRVMFLLAFSLATRIRWLLTILIGDYYRL